MKQYCYQLSTGAVLITPQEIVYTAEGISIDSQADSIEESCINGHLYLGTGHIDRSVSDIVFNSKDIIASWIEE